jgi:hypothetical protein
VRRKAVSTTRTTLGVLFTGLIAVTSPGATVVAGGSPALWGANVAVTNIVASSATTGGGYPDPSGVPTPGTCTLGSFNANHSESWLAVRPGTEDLVGSSKFFFDKYSTFYNFYLGAYRMPGGTPAGNEVVQGYDCVTTGTQAMPPSWTNVTDPNVAFDTRGRVYQVTLPFNAYWTNLHPNGAINLSYSDDLGATWRTGNGGKPLELSPNSSSLSFGHFEDKQWVAVNQISGSPNQDHVYAMWSVFNGFTSVIKVAVSRDRGRTFAPAITLTEPQASGPSNTYIYPSIDAAGTVYVAFSSFPACCGTPATMYVTHSIDDGATWGPFVQAAKTSVITSEVLPNTTFRDGIVENFAASPTYPGHLYLTWEAWDGTQMDVLFSQSTDGGSTWSNPVRVNDNVEPASGPTDQFQPSVAAGPDGAVAIAFYDRRAACPRDASVLPSDAGRTNFCIDASLQAFRDNGGGAVPLGGNVRISKYTWDPENPAQHVDGIGQMACVDHVDPCTLSFIGDYFGLAISGSNVYALFVSTHYPSTVTADEGGPVFYQQQVLSTISRNALGY